MPKKTPLDHMRDICLSLPDTTETPTWGQPHFRVKDKIFAGCGEEKGKQSIGCKLEMEHADILIQHDSRVSRAPYVGHKGWVSIDAAKVKATEWDWVRSLVHESYRLIAPKKTLAAWQGASAPSPVTKKTVKKT
jgi:predicted DNA-binding protein (MmcQ/YjbR family)